MAKFKVNVLTIVRNASDAVTGLTVEFYDGATKLDTAAVAALTRKKVYDYSGAAGALAEVTTTVFNDTTITFTAAQDKNEVIVVEIGDGNDFGRTFVNLFEEVANTDIVDFSYTTPEIAGEYVIGINGEVGELGSADHSFIPQSNTDVTIVAAAADHIASSVTTVAKPYLIKVISKPLPAQLKLDGAINETGFGYEVVLSEHKTKDITDID